MGMRRLAWSPATTAVARRSSRSTLITFVLVAASTGCTNDFDALFAGSGGAASGSGSSVGGAMGGGGSSGGPSTSRSSSSGGPVEMGCADATREAYVDPASEPNIAGCSGGFSVAGVVDTYLPQCLRSAGDDGPVPDGNGCAVEDLCADGWHVCVSSVDVAEHASTGQCPTDTSVPSPFFWLTRQAMNATACAAAVTNNVVGCGDGLGQAAGSGDGCSPLATIMTATLCSAPEAQPWSCGPNMASYGYEALMIVKPSADKGGALCCRD